MRDPDRICALVGADRQGKRLSEVVHRRNDGIVGEALGRQPLQTSVARSVIESCVAVAVVEQAIEERERPRNPTAALR